MEWADPVKELILFSTALRKKEKNSHSNCRLMTSVVHLFKCWPGEGGGYSGSLPAGRSEDRIPGRSEVFPTPPDQPWGPPSHLYNGYWVKPGEKLARAPRLKKEESNTSTPPVCLHGRL